MKVKIHKLFEYLLKTTDAKPEAILGFSLATSPTLGDFLPFLDPNLSLDWSGEDFQGMPALRRNILHTTQLTQTNTVDHVLVTAGAAEANYLAIRQLVGTGDEMIIETPTWQQPIVLGKAIGAKMKFLPRDEEKGWSLDLNRLADLVTNKTKLIFLCNPNNPTGAVLGENALREIAGIADRVGAYLLVDEVYAGLEWAGARVRGIAGIYHRGISTGSVSKTLGLQGLRLGWLISQDKEVVFDSVILRENSSEIMNIMGEAIAEVALRPEHYASALAQAKTEGEENLALLDDFIQLRPELSWHRPPAGLISLCLLHLNMDSETFAQQLLQPPYRTFLMPGTAYGYPKHIRLGVGGGTAVNLPLGLSRLAQFLNDIP